MFCPKCGRESLEGKKFCPSCGLKLRGIVEVMTNEQIQPSDQVFDASPPKQRKWRGSPVYGLYIVILGAIICVIGKGNPLVGQIGAIIALLGLGLMASFALRRSAKWSETKRDSLPPTAPTIELPPITEPQSITEHTTRKLEIKLGRGEKRTPSKELFQP